MHDGIDAEGVEPRCVTHLFACVGQLAAAFERDAPVEAYEAHLTLGEVGRCPALKLDDAARASLEATLREAHAALSYRRSCPTKPLLWGAGRLRAVIEDARRQLDSVPSATVEEALQAARCEVCRHMRDAA